MQLWEAFTGNPGAQGTEIAWVIEVGSYTRGKKGNDQVTVKSLLVVGQLEPHSQPQ